MIISKRRVVPVDVTGVTPTFLVELGVDVDFGAFNAPSDPSPEPA
jgi:hypothetical protein